ncbi:retrovirus-related pol polyprotein from transposon TNT 1-94 [Tanacetum coccineum]
MQTVVQQYLVDKRCLEIANKQVLNENNRLLEQIISQDIVNIVVNSSKNMNAYVNVNSSTPMNDFVNYVEMCNKFLELEAELIKQYNMVEKYEYNKLSKSYSQLEQHCIYLELAMQLNQENFQTNNTSVNQTEPTFDQLFYLKYTSVKPSTIASGSKPLGNTKNDRISRPPCSNEKNKVLRLLVPIALNVCLDAESCCPNCFVFGNDQIAKIMGYGDYQIGNVTILRVYYVEGLGHNLFSVGQFCDSDHEVAFRKHTCFVRNLEGVDLLSGSQETNLYTLSIGDMITSSPIYLCGPIRVASVNGKRYILVIVYDYSRFTWVKFLASNDEAPDFNIKFLKLIQVGISHETSVVRTLQQNSVVERRNRTLVEAARTMLIYAKALLFLWAEAVATASPFVPPSRHEWDLVFQPVFDEFFSPPASVASQVLVVEALALVESTVHLP